MNTLLPILFWGLISSPLTPAESTYLLSPTPVSIPYVTAFDNGFPADWENATSDGAEDWIYSGNQISTYGPDANDHTSGNGGYLWVDDSSPHSQEISLLSPCFDLSGSTSPRLQYWLWSQNESLTATDAILHIDVEVNSVWNLEAFQPISSQGSGWMLIQEDLSAFIAASVRIRFRVEETGSGFQHDIALDDVSVFDASPVDLSVISLLEPSISGCFGSQEAVTVEVYNAGTASLNFTSTPTPISLTTSGASSQSLSESINSGSLAAGDTLLYTFTGTIDLSTTGSHLLSVYTQAIADGNPLNDTLIQAVEQGVVQTAPYLEDFETFTPGGPFANGWIQSATDDQDWVVGKDAVSYSANTGPIDDHTNGGSTYLFAEASAPAQQGDLFDLLSPCINTTGLSLPTLSFWYHMYGSDIGELEVFVLGNGGTTSIFSISGQQQTAETDPWQQAIIPIAGLGDTIQLRFRATRGPGLAGDIALDDIRVSELPNRDLGLTALIEPNAPGCIGSPEAITVELQNFGALPVDFSADPASIAVNISGPLPQTFSQTLQSGTLAPFSSLQATLSSTADFSADGLYSIEGTVSIGGDANAANDTLRATRTRIVPDTVPLPVVNFTNYTGNNLPAFFPGWYEAEGGTIPASPGSSWTADDFANDPFSFLGESARIRLSDTGDQDWLVSPPFVATPQTILCYRIALTDAFGTSAATLGSDDSLSIRVSVDCGATFSSVFTYDASTPLSNIGDIDTVDLGGFAGSEVIVAFYASEGVFDDAADVDLFLDNIQVKEVFPNDIELVEIIRPDPGCNLSSTETVTIVYTNRSNQAIFNPRGAFSVDGGLFGPLEALPAIGAGDTLSISFVVTADLSTVGPHVIKAFATASAPADLNPQNDTLELTVEHQPSISTFPYLESFENGTGGWVATGEQSTWEMGTPSKTTINGAGTGLHAWTTGGLDTLRYQPLERSYVTSPCFDMTQFSGLPWVSLKVWWETEFSWDGAVLQSSADGGSSWKVIGDFGDPNNWYTDNSINSNPGDTQASGAEAGWTGRTETGDGSGGWVQASHPLDVQLLGEPSLQFRIAFSADATFQDDGFAFDDFAIGTLPPVNLGPDQVFCPIGDSLETGLTGTHLWSTGDTSASIPMINTTGVDIVDSLIWVQYTDSLGLSGSDTVFVTILGSGPDVNASQTNVILCPGDSTGSAVAFVSGFGPFSIDWATTPPQTGPLASNLPAGTYGITVSDNLGCTTIDSVEIMGPDSFVVQIDSIQMPACLEVGDGAIAVTTSGGTSPYQYSWNTGANNEDLSSLSAGTYTLSITDINNCTFIASPILLSATDSLPVANFNFVLQSNAQVAFTQNASANASSFQWDFGDGSGTSTSPNPVYTYSSNGSFPVTLIVSNACGSDTFRQNVLLTQVSIANQEFLSHIHFYPNPAKKHLYMEIGEPGLQEVDLSLRDVHGKKVFQQYWNRLLPASRQEIILPSLPAGSYTLDLRSQNGDRTQLLQIE